MKLASTRIVTEDVCTLAQFYAAITGIVPVGMEDYSELETASGTLAICSKRGVDIFHAGAAVPAANRSVIIEFEVRDVDRERSRLDRLVGEFVMEPTNQPWGSRSMLFRDPDGNLVIFFTQTSAATCNCGMAPSPNKGADTQLSAERSATCRKSRNSTATINNPSNNNMKNNRVIHWTITAAISFFMLFSAYVSGTRLVEFAHLGFPNYFRIELTVAKIIGAVMLLIPQVPARVKEWICVCFGVVLISAAIAKFNSGYPAPAVLEPIFVLIIMVSGLLYLNKLNKAPNMDLRPSFSR